MTSRLPAWPGLGWPGRTPLDRGAVRGAAERCLAPLRKPLEFALAGKAACTLAWTGTWDLETDLPFYVVGSADPAPLQVIIRFELPVPIRVEKLLTTGFGLSRSAARGMVDSGRIRLPVAIDARHASPRP